MRHLVTHPEQAYFAREPSKSAILGIEEDVMTLVGKSIGFAAALGICALGFALTLA